MNRSVSGTRRGLHLAEIVILLIGIVFLIALLLPARQSVPDGRGWTMNNLKQIGIALNNYAGGNNNRLPSASVAEARFFFSGPKGTAAGPAYEGGLLSYMEGNVKCLVSPQDINVGTVPAPSRAATAFLFPGQPSTAATCGCPARFSAALPSASARPR